MSDGRVEIQFDDIALSEFHHQISLPTGSSQSNSGRAVPLPSHVLCRALSVYASSGKPVNMILTETPPECRYRKSLKSDFDDLI
jgi:hypothetical protein